MKLLDTNIIIYAVGKPNYYKIPCQEILKMAATYPEEYNIDAELCQELLYVYGRRGERELGFKTIESILALFPNTFAIDSNIIFETKNIMSKYAEIIARDAIHAAVVIINNLEGIVSVDKVFDRIKGLKRFEP